MSWASRLKVLLRDSAAGHKGLTNTKICIFKAKYTAGDFVRCSSAHAHLLIYGPFKPEQLL